MAVLERIPELACTACKGDLVETEFGLDCKTCHAHYDLIDDIPRMLGGDLIDFAEEIAVQDRVAVEYEAKRYQDPHAARYHAWWTEQMLSAVSTDGRVLDNGCGVGLLGDRVPAERLVGLDISSEMLVRASQSYDQLILGNSQELPLREASFDTVLARSLLHHLPKPELAVAEMQRVLRPGGEMVLVDTNASLISTIPRWIKYRGEHFSEEHQNLSRRRLTELLEPHFRIDTVRYFGYIAYPLVGFPDLVGVFRYVPMKSVATTTLMTIDNVLSKIPLIRSQGWAILIKGTRR